MMADNYLENKMEEHRRRSSAPAAVRKHPRPSTLSPVVKLPDFSILHVYVINDLNHPAGADIISAFRSVGATVAYTTPDNRQGLKDAQACGAKFIPAEIEDPWTYIPDADLVIILGKNRTVIDSVPTVWSLDSAALDSPTIKDFLVLRAATLPVLFPEFIQIM